MKSVVIACLLLGAYLLVVEAGNQAGNQGQDLHHHDFVAKRFISSPPPPPILGKKPLCEPELCIPHHPFPRIEALRLGIKHFLPLGDRIGREGVICGDASTSCVMTKLNHDGVRQTVSRNEFCKDYMPVRRVFDGSIDSRDISCVHKNIIEKEPRKLCSPDLCRSAFADEPAVFDDDGDDYCSFANGVDNGVDRWNSEMVRTEDFCRFLEPLKNSVPEDCTTLTLPKSRDPKVCRLGWSGVSGEMCYDSRSNIFKPTETVMDARRLQRLASDLDVCDLANCQVKDDKCWGQRCCTVKGTPQSLESFCERYGVVVVRPNSMECFDSNEALSLQCSPYTTCVYTKFSLTHKSSCSARQEWLDTSEICYFRTQHLNGAQNEGVFEQMTATEYCEELDPLTECNKAKKARKDRTPLRAKLNKLVKDGEIPI
eukprot:GILJ01003531.1.p1 GENE.GILJ01003531.1~~GILJ01003531.1.p1  ORF type:complete len:446 (-),score=39.87 GILJ01003531.1:159-1439(-)